MNDTVLLDTENDFNDEGLNALSAALKINTTVTSIHLEGLEAMTLL